MIHPVNKETFCNVYWLLHKNRTAISNYAFAIWSLIIFSKDKQECAIMDEKGWHNEKVSGKHLHVLIPVYLHAAVIVTFNVLNYERVTLYRTWQRHSIWWLRRVSSFEYFGQCSRIDCSLLNICQMNTDEEHQNKMSTRYPFMHCTEVTFRTYGISG